MARPTIRQAFFAATFGLRIRGLSDATVGDRIDRLIDADEKTNRNQIKLARDIGVPAKRGNSMRGTKSRLWEAIDGGSIPSADVQKYFFGVVALSDDQTIPAKDSGQRLPASPRRLWKLVVALLLLVSLLYTVL